MGFNLAFKGLILNHKGHHFYPPNKLKLELNYQYSLQKYNTPYFKTKRIHHVIKLKYEATYF